jgi:hypothetical protein
MVKESAVTAPGNGRFDAARCAAHQANFSTAGG